MNQRTWRIVVLISFLGFLTGCGGGEATEAVSTPAPTAQASLTPQSTTPPTPTLEPIEAIIVDVINDVDAHAQPEQEWQDAVVDMPIYPGGEVWAQEASTARVAVEQDLVRVAPNTIFALEQPDADTLKLTLDEGQAWINVEGLEGDETFEVETPGAVASVRGTRFGVRLDSSGATIVSTQMGTVTVSAVGATAVGTTVVVTTGLQTTVLPGDPPGAPEPMSPEERVRWGMAVGTGLDVALPVVGVTDVFSHSGYISEHDCLAGGRYFAFSYYDHDSETSKYVYYDAQAGVLANVDLPSEVDEVAFNPTGDGLAYLDMDVDEICTADIDAGNPSCFPSQPRYNRLHWSPDGEWLLFYPYVEDTGTGLNLFKVRPDGSGLTQLTSGDMHNVNPSWSGDGSQIAYTVIEEFGEAGDLWVVGADGSDLGMVITGTTGHGFAAWNPDGTLLAIPGHWDYEAEEGGGLWIVPVDGSDPWVVPGTEDTGCYNPVWSPTSSGWPLFCNCRGVRSYAPDGGVETIYLPGAMWGPTWCLDGTQQAAFGFMGRSEYSKTGDEPEQEPWTDVYFFQVEPGLWP